MKKVKRKSIAPKILAAENAAITQFVLDVLKPLPGAKLPIASLFESYQVWRRIHKMAPTKLEIDGFGRLFPHIYPRRSSWWPPAKHALKCVFGVGTR